MSIIPVDETSPVTTPEASSPETEPQPEENIIPTSTGSGDSGTGR